MTTVDDPWSVSAPNRVGSGSGSDIDRQHRPDRGASRTDVKLAHPKIVAHPPFEQARDQRLPRCHLKGERRRRAKRELLSAPEL
jgi:hypothetical protein